MDLLDLKLKLCDNILTLLQKLDTGQCKMRGLLLFEKYQCLEEIKRKENNNVSIVSGGSITISNKLKSSRRLPDFYK